MLLFTTGIEAQGPTTYTPVHLINLETKDNPEEATLGAFLILELCEMVNLYQILLKTVSVLFDVTQIDTVKACMMGYRPLLQMCSGCLKNSQYCY